MKITMRAVNRGMICAGLMVVGLTPVNAQNQTGSREQVVTGRHFDPGDVQVEYVKYDDINLLSDSGEKALRQRVKGAAKRVCGA